VIAAHAAAAWIGEPADDRSGKQADERRGQHDDECDRLVVEARLSQML
jgi:hypothetical protein